MENKEARTVEYSQTETVHSLGVSHMSDVRLWKFGSIPIRRMMMECER